VRDVLVTPFAPVLGGGGRLRTYAVAAALSRLHDLEVVFGRFGGDGPSAEYRSLEGVTFTAVDRARLPRRVATYAERRLRDRIPASWARGVWPGLAATALERAGTDAGTRLIADGPVAGAALLPAMQRRPVVYLAHNLESGFRHQLGGASPGELRALRRFEQELIARASETWMVSSRDAAGACELAPAAHVRVVPNAVDVQAIEPVEPVDGSALVLMVADFTYEPNRDGLDFLLREVMPELWRTRPYACVQVVGRGLEGRDAPDPRVRFAGFVPELRSSYASAACAVVPLRHGGGSPLKFVEALAYGVPVVATPYAAAGLDVGAGVHYLAAEDAPAFAASIAATFDGDGAAVAERGRLLAEKRYSIEALTGLLAHDRAEEARHAVRV
jgi:glycosyltransferase involved in cell wall biosynthesis